jgi:hypothetical protein
VLAAAVAMPWAESTLLHFLEQGRLDGGLAAISFRLAVLVAGAMCIHTYGDLVRGSDRAVLDPHPVQARKLLRALAWRTGLERIYLPLICGILLLPVGFRGHWLHMGAGTMLIFAGYWTGLGVGQATHLGAVWAARSPGLARLLDAIRGANPRMQAALIYAPGFALGLAGTALALASAGLESALGGWGPGWAWMALPWLLGWAGLVLTGPLADRYYVKTTALLGEIDAMYAGIETEEEERAVYLEWLARGRPEMLRALRHGWRGLRLWPMGGWLMGAVLGVVALSTSADAPRQVATMGGAGALLVVAVIFRMAAHDPQWLDRALGVSARKVAIGRMAVAFLYAQGVLLPAALGLWIRHGLDSCRVLLPAEILALTGASVAAWMASEWRGRAIWAYGPLGILLWTAGLAGQV